MRQCEYLKDIVVCHWWDICILPGSIIEPNWEYREDAKAGVAVGKFVKIDEKELVLASVITLNSPENDCLGTLFVIPLDCIVAYRVIKEDKKPYIIIEEWVEEDFGEKE